MSMQIIEKKTVSQLPRPTWNWLHINKTEASWQWDQTTEKSYAAEPAPQIPEGIIVHRNTMPFAAAKPDTTTSLSGQIPQVVERHLNHSLHVEIPEGIAADEPLLIDYSVNSSHSLLINRLFITAHPNSRASVVIRYHSPDPDSRSGDSGEASAGSADADAVGAANNVGADAGDVGAGGPARHWGFTTIDVAENAELKVTQLQMLDSAGCHNDAIAAEVGANGKLCLLLSETGSHTAAASCDVRLIGREAQCHLDSLYLAGGEQQKDLNYRIFYEAEDTEGIISARGALAGAARKVFKSTIDFLPGARRSKGREEETVLVLSDQVRNVSTPLLLCGEDNVEGQHATSIGRPDPGKLYYLKSRGFSERDARKLLVEASFSPFLDQLQPEHIKEQLVERIREVIHDESI